MKMGIFDSMKNAFKSKQERIDGLLYSGNIKALNHWYEEAIEYYDKAIEINPHHELVWYNKGMSLYNLNRNNEAIECLDKAIEINPQNDTAWSNKANALVNLGVPEEAIECYTKALEINPNNNDAEKFRGVFLKLKELKNKGKGRGDMTR
jgi:tetratricopeptide (TPR) repeat protein